MTKVPDYCMDEVSDHTLALLLALARKIPFANAQVHAGAWSKFTDLNPLAKPPSP